MGAAVLVRPTPARPDLPLRHLPVIVSLSVATAPIACTPFKVDPPLGSADSGASPPEGGLPAHPWTCDLHKPFGQPIFVPGLTTFSSTLSGINDLTLSADNRTAYFLAFPLDGVGSLSLYSATRSSPELPFENLAPVDAIQVDPGSENGATVRGDGLLLIFAKTTPGSGHLYYATRPSVALPFTYAGELPGVNGSKSYDGTPFLREDGRYLYFSSDRDAAAGGLHIYRAAWNGSGFDAPVLMRELATTSVESQPVVTPDDRTIYFRTAGPGAEAGSWNHVWMATRSLESEPFSAPTPVSELDSPDRAEVPSFVSRDGCTLYFGTYSRGPLYAGDIVTYMADRLR